MPTYDFYCDDCKYTEEHYHGILKNPTFKCPKCGKKMRRLIGKGMPPKVKGALSNYKGT